MSFRHPGWECENARIWECENVRMWECDNMRMWECENMRIWECENMRMWECENVRIWQCPTNNATNYINKSNTNNRACGVVIAVCSQVGLLLSLGVPVRLFSFIIRVLLISWSTPCIRLCSRILTGYAEECEDLLKIITPATTEIHITKKMK